MTEITENKEIIKYQTANAKQLAIKRLPPSKINAWITGSLGPWKPSFSISSKPFSQLWSPDVLYGTLLCKDDVIFIVYKSAHLRFGVFFLPFYLPHLFFLNLCIYPLKYLCKFGPEGSNLVFADCSWCFETTPQSKQTQNRRIGFVRAFLGTGSPLPEMFGIWFYRRALRQERNIWNVLQIFPDISGFGLDQSW